MFMLALRCFGSAACRFNITGVDDPGQARIKVSFAFALLRWSPVLTCSLGAAGSPPEQFTGVSALACCYIDRQCFRFLDLVHC